MSYIYKIHNIHSGFDPTFLYIIICISIISGVLIITSKNPIVSVLYLILLFSSISCYLVFIGLNFLGLSYLLVYVGAVSILFLFILMLINIRVSELISDTTNNIPLGIFTIIAFYVPLSETIPSVENTKPSAENTIINRESIHYVSSNSWDSKIVDISDITSIGNIMYSTHSMWLILTSVILLLAMVGSIVITIKQKYIE